MEKSFPTLVSQHVESNQGQEGGSTVIDINAYASCRNRVYDDNVPPPKPVAGGRSPCSSERAALRLSGPMTERPASHSSHSAGGCPHQRKERFCSRTCTVAPLKALKSRRLTANMLETLSRERIIATHKLRCVAVRREWIRVTAPGNSVTEIGSCRVGMISEFARSQCVVEPCAAGGDILRAAHHAWGRPAERSLEGGW